MAIFVLKITISLSLRAETLEILCPSPRARLCFLLCLFHIRLFVCGAQEAIIQIMKMRKRINNAQLQTELVEILKNMFLPQKKMIKEQIEWLIDHKYIKRDETDINTFIYMA